MAVRFEMQAHGDKLVARELTRLGDRALDASAAFEEIAGQFMRAEKRRFETVGDGTWPPITASTRARKAASKNPTVVANANRVLVATGQLRRSLSVPGAPDQQVIVQPRSLTFSTTVPYAGYLQRGTSRMPARKPLGFTEHAKRDAVRTLQRHIIERRI